MTTQHTNQHLTENGHSRFAKRGQSSEERMPEDDSAEKFEDAAILAEHEGTPTTDGRAYGAGGSYGYGGGFDHGGQRGYDVSFAHERPTGEQEEFYESTGGFGRDTEGYGRAGIGHPGKDEKRPDAQPSDGAPASELPASANEDERKGYSQDAGYAQSGGNPAPGGTKPD